MKEKLKNDAELQWSPIVANNSMNRKRQAIGVNSYEKDIKLNPIKYISQKLQQQEEFIWLDLCCGEGNALIQAGEHFYQTNQSAKLNFIGIDLVNFFNEVDPSINDMLTLEALNLSDWTPDRAYDLVTIVHGLHYIGDKIGLLLKIAQQLKPDGVVIGNLDINNIKIEGTTNSNKIIKSYFENNGIHYNSRTKIISIEGTQTIPTKFEYLGADDKAGPNYTGQEVVNSFYRFYSKISCRD